MTVLADHDSPYRALTLPSRQTLQWRPEGRHFLVCDPQSQAEMAAFLTGSPPRDHIIVAAPTPDVLCLVQPDDHLLAIGAEPFLQMLHAMAWAAQIRAGQMQFQRSGPDYRDVLCMHCRTTCRAVTHRIHLCHCGINILVRDHFSPRLGLYQGAPLPADDGLIGMLSMQALGE